MGQDSVAEASSSHPPEEAGYSEYQQQHYNSFEPDAVDCPRQMQWNRSTYATSYATSYQQEEEQDQQLVNHHQQGVYVHNEETSFNIQHDFYQQFQHFQQHLNQSYNPNYAFLPSPCNNSLVPEDSAQLPFQWNPYWNQSWTYPSASSYPPNNTLYSSQGSYYQE